MFVRDNYGAKWVKGMLNWFRNKTLEGKLYSHLLIEAMLETGLRRGKSIELVNEYLELGLMHIEEGKVYWSNPDMKSTDIGRVKLEEQTATPTEKKPVKKKTRKKKKKKTLQEKLVEYNEYTEYMKIENETPLEYEGWVTMKGYK